jgi:hypothetical protein
MKYALKLTYRWKVLTEDGLLKAPKDRWGGTHPLSKEYNSRHEAIEDYIRFVNNDLPCPSELTLIETHKKDLNWDE